MIGTAAAQVRRHAAILREASGYVIVSALALGVDLSVYWLLLGLEDRAYLPAAAGYLCGLAVHYVLASRLVFPGRLDNRGVAAEAPTFAKYAATGVLGLLMTSGIVGMCTELLGWSPISAKLLATLVSFVAVYLARRHLVFGNMPATPDARSPTSAA